MSLSSIAGAATQAMGEYSGTPFLRDLSGNLFRMAEDNLWYIIGGLAVVIVVWLYVRR